MVLVYEINIKTLNEFQQISFPQQRKNKAHNRLAIKSQVLTVTHSEKKYYIYKLKLKRD